MPYKPRRRRMKEFRIEELSVVDRPAQEGALAVIVKNRSSRKYNENHDPDNGRFTSGPSGGGGGGGSKPNEDDWDFGGDDSLPPPKGWVDKPRGRKPRDRNEDDWDFGGDDSLPPPKGWVDKPRGRKKRAMNKSEVVQWVISKWLEDPADGQSVLFGQQPRIAKSHWPLLAALDTSLHSILVDPNLGDVQKMDMMRESTSEFLDQVKKSASELEGYIHESMGSGGRSAKAMNLGQLKKQMNELSGKLDRVVAKLQARQDVEKVDDDPDHTDLMSKGGDESNDDREEQDAAERLRALFGRAKAASAAEKADEDDEDEEMPLDEESDEEEDEDMLAEYRRNKGGDYSMGDMDADKAMDTKEDEGLITTEGEEDEPIGGGSTTPVGKGRVRLNKRDEVIEVGGRQIRKSAIGSDMFAVIKTQQAEVQRLAKAAAEEKHAREIVEFSKTAETELASLPGTPLEKARLLKRLSKNLGDEDRRLLSRMLRAGDRGVSAAFKTVGHSVGKAATGSFEKRVSEIRARDNCSRTAAMQKARAEYPDEFAAFQGN